MEDATDKCNAASRREDQFDGQVDTVNQNAQLVLDGVVRKRDVSVVVLFQMKFSKKCSI